MKQAHPGYSENIIQNTGNWFFQGRYLTYTKQKNIPQSQTATATSKLWSQERRSRLLWHVCVGNFGISLLTIYGMALQPPFQHQLRWRSVIGWILSIFTNGLCFSTNQNAYVQFLTIYGNSKADPESYVWNGENKTEIWWRSSRWRTLSPPWRS